VHIADRDDGSDCRVQDPDEYREKEADVADLSSSTDSDDGVAVGRAARRVYERHLGAERHGCLFHVKHER
jgi:hypothetical protein